MEPEAKIKELEAENVELLKQITDLETELTNAQERFHRLFMASNAVAIEHDDGTTEIIV